MIGAVFNVAFDVVYALIAIAIRICFHFIKRHVNHSVRLIIFFGHGISACPMIIIVAAGIKYSLNLK